MYCRLIINIELDSHTGDPMQVEAKLKEIANAFRRTAELERTDPDNRVVYNDWEDPHECDLLITVRED